MDNKRRRKTDEHDRQLKSRRMDEKEETVTKDTLINNDRANAVNEDDDTDDENRLQIDEQADSNESKSATNSSNVKTANQASAEGTATNGLSAEEADEEDGDELEYGANIYAAEKLLKKRKYRGQIEYLVKWKDWSDEYNTWEPAFNIIDKRLIEEFNQTVGANKSEAIKNNQRVGRKPKGHQSQATQSSINNSTSTEETLAKTTTTTSNVNKSKSKQTTTSDQATVGLKSTQDLDSKPKVQNKLEDVQVDKSNESTSDSAKKTVKPAIEKRPLIENNAVTKEEQNVDKNCESIDQLETDLKKARLELNENVSAKTLGKDIKSTSKSDANEVKAPNNATDLSLNPNLNEESCKNPKSDPPVGITLALLRENQESGRTITANSTTNASDSTANKNSDGKENAQSLTSNDSSSLPVSSAASSTVVSSTVTSKCNSSNFNTSKESTTIMTIANNTDTLTTSQTNSTSTATSNSSVRLNRPNATSETSNLPTKMQNKKDIAKQKQTIELPIKSATGILNNRDTLNTSNRLVSQSKSSTTTSTSYTFTSTQASSGASLQASKSDSIGMSNSNSQLTKTVSSIVSSLSSSYSTTSALSTPVANATSLTASQYLSNLAQPNFPIATSAPFNPITAITLASLSTSLATNSISSLPSTNASTNSLTSNVSHLNNQLPIISHASIPPGQPVGICSATLIGAPASIVTAPTNLLNSPNFLQLAKAVGSITNPIQPLSNPNLSFSPNTSSNSLNSPRTSAFSALPARATLINNPLIKSAATQSPSSSVTGNSLSNQSGLSTINNISIKSFTPKDTNNKGINKKASNDSKTQKSCGNNINNSVSNSSTNKLTSLSITSSPNLTAKKESSAVKNNKSPKVSTSKLNQLSDQSQQPLQVQNQQQSQSMTGNQSIKETNTTTTMKTFQDASKAILMAQQQGIKRCSPPPDFIRKQMLADQIIVTDVSEKNVMITIRECKSQELFFRKPANLKRKKQSIKIKHQQRTITAG